MIPLEYAYLFGASLCFIPWGVIYFSRPDLRRPMIVMGGIFSLLGVPLEYFWWTRDWWGPLTVTGTVVGIEDVILSFTNSGIASVLYLFLANKKYVSGSGIDAKSTQYSIAAFVSIMSIFALLYHVAGIHTFIITCVGMWVCTMLLAKEKPRLLIAAMYNGVAMAVLMLPIYWITEWISPGFIGQTWKLRELSGSMIIGIPIEDVVFYFFTGAVCFLYYPYLYNKKSLIPSKK